MVSFLGKSLKKLRLGSPDASTSRCGLSRLGASRILSQAGGLQTRQKEDLLQKNGAETPPLGWIFAFLVWFLDVFFPP